MTKLTNLTCIKGMVQEVRYRNEDNNYTVIILEVNDEFVTATGKFPIINEGEWVELNGKFVLNKKYGEQFAVDSVKLSPPNTKDGIIRYLSSGLIPGVGPITAANIVNKFGEATLDIIRYNPRRLAEVRNVSLKKAEEICKAYEEVHQMQNAVMIMQQYHISTNLAIKIYNQYGEGTEDILKNNPYKIVEDVSGVGFFTADKIAMAMGVPEDSDYRVRAGVLHVLRENSDKNGNTCMQIAALIEGVFEILNIPNLQTRAENVIEKLILDGYLMRLVFDDEVLIALSQYYKIERVLADSLLLLDSDCDESELNIDEEIAHYEQVNNIKMHEHQKAAVNIAVNNGVSIITGGPGTGKTTIVKCMLQIFKSMGKTVKLMAPTGRASKRLSESTGENASTIHRALEMTGGEDSRFMYNNQTKLSYDVIIVDEVSMVDSQLMYYLVRSIKRGSKLVLVGDKDQLASVGAGNVLADLLESGCFATMCLTQIYRQSEDSLIIVNAHEINKGNMPKLDNKSKDFFFERRENNDEALKSIVDMCVSRIPKFMGVDSSNIQVLAPMKSGVVGIDNINKELQDKLNPSSLSKCEVETDKVIYRTGDRVMQTSNNYERTWIKDGVFGAGVFNGDIGIITDIDMSTSEVVIEFEDGRVARYIKSDLSEITLSYAITIHKSQGSEFDVVIIPALSGPPMLLTRNLLYTAVTRAKKMVVIIGTKQSVARMVHNNYTKVRYTMLKRFLDLDGEKKWQL
ncbi:MAG: ATP-dependent RecD-like DNA helicase [Clostridiales bacterium]|nr:ATP-dependent RecD-like DNA helicase [Clostridiales bacterium]